MASLYTNLPPVSNNNANAGSVLQAVANYYAAPIQLDANVLTAIISFFTQRGFDTTAAQALATVIISQARKDNLNPLQIVDTMKGLTNVEISALVAEIINYTRYKTSFLGYGQTYITNATVNRNVLP
jgi:hypothetical protein